MMPNYDSYYKAYANQTLNWILGDTEEKYQHNLMHNYDKMRELGWIDVDVTYKFNSLGFRCDEFTDDPTAMFLGCSHTVGVGLPVNDIWPEIVAGELKLKCANLGQGGGSADSSFRLCHGYIDKINPKIVFYMEAPAARFEIITDDPIPHGPWDIEDRYRDWFSNENNSFFNQARNLLAIKMLCAERNIKLVQVSCFDLHHLDGSLARDLGHYGVKSHYRFAHDLLNTIQ